MPTTTTNTAAEFKALLSTQNKGIKQVTIEEGIVCVYTKSRKAIMGVMMDLKLSRGFRSVAATVNGLDGGFIVHAVPN